MRESTLAILGTLSVLAMPLSALEQTTLPRVRVEPVEGATSYQARLYWRDGEIYHARTYESAGDTPIVELGMLTPDPCWIKMRACINLECGNWSVPHWNTADLDGSGLVDFGDFMVLVREWRDRGTLDYIEMAQHWGQTVVEEHRLRRYIEEDGGPK